MDRSRLFIEATNTTQGVIEDLMLNLFNLWFKDGNYSINENIDTENPEELRFEEWFSYN